MTRGTIPLALLLIAAPAFVSSARAQAPSASPTLPTLPLPDGATAPQPAPPGALAPSGKIYTGTGLPPVPGSTAAIDCPALHGGRMLASSDVYDGPPLRGTLMPLKDGEWNLPPHAWPGNAYYLSCEYGYDRPPLGIRLPQRVKLCKRPTDDPTQVACR